MRSGKPGLVTLLLSPVHFSKQPPISPVSVPLPPWDAILPWLVRNFSLNPRRQLHNLWSGEVTNLFSLLLFKLKLVGYRMELETTWDLRFSDQLSCMNRNLKFYCKTLEELFLFAYKIFYSLNKEMPRGVKIQTEVSQVGEKFNLLWFKIWE